MNCAACGEPLTSTHPRARFCSVNCRVKASQRRKQGIPELRPAPKPRAEQTPGELYAACLRELSAAGVADTWQAQAALALALRIDQKVDNGFGLAAACRQFTASYLEALRRAPHPPGAPTAR